MTEYQYELTVDAMTDTGATLLEYLYTGALSPIIAREKVDLKVLHEIALKCVISLKENYEQSLLCRYTLRSLQRRIEILEPALVVNEEEKTQTEEKGDDEKKRSSEEAILPPEMHVHTQLPTHPPLMASTQVHFSSLVAPIDLYLML